VTPARLKTRIPLPIIERFRPNSWYASVLAVESIGVTTFSAEANRLYAMLFPVPRKSAFDKMALRIYSGGDRARLGVYEADDDIYPSKLVIDAGEVTPAAPEAEIDVALSKGYYFLAFVLNVTAIIQGSTRYLTPIKSGEANRIGYYVEYGYGALPASYPKGAFYEANLYGISLRFVKHV